ncbi:Y121 [Enterospora canceri]|uniref:Y121 n=1 Tax=Enterospora canceri TaxID=1081671 RepID=A0A1Y1S8N4_9MICR|nr:Y121 [Enterospora canceri]
MADAETKRKIQQIQKEVEGNFNEYLKREYALKMEFQKQNEGILAERDSLFQKMEEDEMREMMTAALDNFPEIHSKLPVVVVGEDECYDCEFIKFIKAEYLENYRIKVTVDLFENPYVEQTRLERTFGFMAREEGAMQLTYKDGVESCPLFAYFESDDETLEMFDLFYEFYANLPFYAYSEE